MVRHNTNLPKNNIKLRKKQDGLTAIALILILAIIAFFTLISLRLFPIYLEYYNVSSHINQLAEDVETRTLGDEAILSTLRKRFQIDDVKSVDVDSVTIERAPGSMVVGIEYEVRTPTIGNVDMVVSFDKEVEVN